MNFEIVKKSNKTKIIMGLVVLLILTSVVMFVSTRAKYRSIQSVKLANGTINYSAPDLKLAIKVSEDGETYTSRTDIPTSGYTFNTEKSKCRIPTSTLTGENAPVAEGVTIEYTDGKINVLGVTQKDTRCYVYFDKVRNQTSSSIITAIEKSSSYKTGTPDFTQVATGSETEANNGIYKVADGMYNGSSYYWRGAATTNHVIFDNKCWRIVRINGDKSIRLIYNGTPSENTCINGANSNSIVLQDTVYNDISNYSASIGWTNVALSQRPSNTSPQTGGTAAPIKTALENWYNTNITNKSKVVAGNFCNDRNVDAAPSSWGNGYVTTWSIDKSPFAYASAIRLYGKYTPTLSCPSGDMYNLNVGMITADEVEFAGGKQDSNTSYYLYTSKSYWTMSPASYNTGNAWAFYVHTNGSLERAPANTKILGIRPVINLRSDVTFNSGSDGTQNNPYIVQ